MFFFFNDTATTEIYTLSLHDALPIFAFSVMVQVDADVLLIDEVLAVGDAAFQQKCFDVFYRLKEQRSEEHTSELQSRQYLVCRLLLEKKKIYIANQSWLTYCCRAHSS